MTLIEKNKFILTTLLTWDLECEIYADANRQFDCVRRIAEIEGISVLRAYWLLDSFYPFVYPAMELEDVFEAIFNYTNHHKDFINSLR